MEKCKGGVPPLSPLPKKKKKKKKKKKISLHVYPRGQRVLAWINFHKKIRFPLYITKQMFRLPLFLSVRLRMK